MNTYERLHHADQHTDVPTELRTIATALRERAGELYATLDGTACLAITELATTAARLQLRAADHEENHP